MMYILLPSEKDSVKIKPLHRNNKEVESGVACRFYRLKTKDALKLWSNKIAATKARKRQITAAAAGLGPKVLSGIQPVLDYESLKIKYGYLTQIALKAKNTSRKEIEELTTQMKKLKFSTWDLHSKNVGRIAGKLVCIDFGDESMR